MLKQLSKKMQQIPISIEIVHFFVFTIIIRQINTFFIFQKHISKANKILFNFLHSE